MAMDIDRESYLQSLSLAIQEKESAYELGKKLAAQGLRRIFLVGCGAPNREMGAIKYWLDKYAQELETYLYFPAELLYQKPHKLNQDTLVVLASHSGTTPEVVAMAEKLKAVGCPVVGVTQLADSPLAKNVAYPLLYGESKNGYQAKFILLMALLAGVMKQVENWTLAENIMADLNKLPLALVDAMESNEKRAAEDARLYKDDDFIMILGSGPVYSTAYVFGVCVLMEMQWMHTFVGEAAEFFHGPFEVLDQNTPVIIFLGEDPSRPIAERVVRFCKKFTERLMIYDSKDYAMAGISPEVRPIVAPFVLEAAISRMADHLAVWHNHPLTTRRYMWKFEY